MPVEEKIEEQVPPTEIAGALEELPILSVRDTVLFPHALLPINVGRPSSMALVSSLGENRLLGVVSQIDPREDAPGPKDLYEVGTVAMIHKVVRMKEGTLLFCEGVSRMRTMGYTSTDPYLRARIERLPEMEPEPTPALEALRRNVVGIFQQIVAASPNLSDDLAAAVKSPRAPGRARTGGCARPPRVRSQASGARTGIDRAAQQDSIPSAGPALADTAGVLLARAVEGHPERTGRERRWPARSG
jgi:ATP-dependent Lon protease